MSTLPIIAIALFSILALGILIVAYGIFKALNRIIVNPIPKETVITLKKSSEYNLLLARLILKLRDELNSCKILVARFHNGGFFNNGMHMEKFSVYMETPSANSLIPCMQDNYRDVFNSRYPEVFAQLVVWGEYICTDIEDCIDVNFKNDAKKCGYGSVNLFLVKQLDGTEEGFIGVNFKNTHLMTQEERSKVIDQLPTIRGFLNMTKQ